MAYAIYRSDNVAATKDGSQIKSARYYVDGAVTAIENGNIVAINSGLVEGEREILKATTPTATTPVNELGIVTTVELMYEEGKRDLGEFINEATSTQVLRVFKFHNGDVFSVTADALNGTPVKGTTSVVVGASTKMVVKATSSVTDSEVVIGNIIDTETIGTTTYWTIEVVC